MPEPISKFSPDYYLYPLRNKLSKHLCFIHPNFVTLIGLFMVIPFLYNLYYDRSILECVLFFIIIYELDCFDGSIARTCNKITKYGALFDIISDTIRFILVSFVILYKLKDILNSLQLSFITLITLVIIYIMRQLIWRIGVKDGRCYLII